MFEKAITKLFWKQKYNESWRRDGFYFQSVSDSIHGININLEFLKWDRRIDEKKAYWERRGKLLGYKPEKAMLYGLQEACSEFYEAYKDEEDMEDYWLRLAGKLGFIAEMIVSPINFEYYGSDLREPWSSLYRKVREEDKIRRQKEKEMRSYSFPIEELEKAWEDILLEPVPQEAKRIWSQIPRGATNAIILAERANVTLKEFAFWAVIFRNNKLIKEFDTGGLRYTKEAPSYYSDKQNEVIKALSET